MVYHPSSVTALIALLTILRGKPPVGAIDFGQLRRTTPISGEFGFDRGLPMDRYYIERFLTENKGDVRGRVLEVQDNAYTLLFGTDRVNQSDVLHVKEGNAKANIVADFTKGENLPSDTYDCIILTQVLQHIYDVRAALKTVYRILKPGGVVLITDHGIGQLSRADMEEWGEFWRFTTPSLQRLMEEVFPPAQVQMRTFGNVLTALSQMHGIASGELSPKELEHRDENYEVLVCARGVKPL